MISRAPLAAALVFPALVIAACVLIAARNGFNGLYGQDSYAYVDYALGPLREALAALEPPPAFFWPPGYPLLVALVSMATGLADSAGQAVSLIAGGLTPIFIALLAWELLASRADRPPRAFEALFAGLVAAVAGHLWQSSIAAMADTTAVAAASAGAWALARYDRTGGGRWLVLAGAAIAFAVEIRIAYGLVALVLAAGAMIAVRRHAAGTPRVAVLHVAAGAAAALVVLLPMLVPIVQAALDGRPIPFISTFGAFGWDPLSAFRPVHETPDGRLVYTIATGLFYLLQPIQHYWFVALGLLVVPGALAVVRRPTVVTVAILLAWPALAFVFLAGIGQQNTRYAMMILPPIAVLVAFGARWLVDTARRRAGHGAPTAVRIAALGLAAAVVLNGVLAARFADGFAARMVDDRNAILSLTARVPDDARLVTLGPLAMLEHLGRRNLVDLNALDIEPIRALLAEDRDTYLLVDVEAIRRQWSERGAGRAFAVAESEWLLEPIGSAGPWSLLRIGR